MRREEMVKNGDDFNPEMPKQMEHYRETFQWLQIWDFEELQNQVIHAIEGIRKEDEKFCARPDWKKTQDSECEHILWNLYTSLNAAIMLKSHFEMASSIENMKKKIADQAAELREFKAPETVAKVLMGEEKSRK